MTVKVRFDGEVREYAKGEKVKDSILKLTETALAQALEGFHRRMIVIEGDTTRKAELAGGILAGAAARTLNGIIDELVRKRLRDEGEDRIEVLYATDALGGEETFGRKRYEAFRKHFDVLAGSNVEVQAVTFKHTRDILGRTYDLLVLDMSYDYSPNDLGRIIETVRGGGGLIFILAHPFEKWKNMWTGFHKSLVTPPPYTIDDVKKRFNRRLIRKFTEHEASTSSPRPERRKRNPGARRARPVSGPGKTSPPSLMRPFSRASSTRWPSPRGGRLRFLGHLKNSSGTRACSSSPPIGGGERASPSG